MAREFESGWTVDKKIYGHSLGRGGKVGHNLLGE